MATSHRTRRAPCRCRSRRRARLLNSARDPGVQRPLLPPAEVGRGAPADALRAVLLSLDKVGHWNRLHGRAGFYQYQCLVPPSAAEAAIEELMREIAASGAAPRSPSSRRWARRARPACSRSRAKAPRSRSTSRTGARQTAGPARPVGRHRPPSRRAALSRQGWPHAGRHVPLWISRNGPASRPTSIRASARTSGGRVAGVSSRPAAKRVIVLGALSAIGEATARLYAADGARG